MSVDTVRWHSWKDKGWILFYSPAILVLALVVFYPLVYMFYMSLHSYSLYDPKPVFVGLKNYASALLSKSGFMHAFVVTTLYIIISLPFEIGIGFIIAILLFQNLKGFNVLRSLLVMPLMTMSVVTGLSWRYIFNSNFGLLKYLASLVGIENMPVWFANPTTALIAIAIVNIWQNTPFSALVLLAGLQAFPQSLVDAAAIDGASYLSIIIHLMIPWLKNIFWLIIALRVLDGYKLYDYVYMLTGGGPGNSTQSIAYYTYQWTFTNLQIGYGNALATLALVLSLLVGIFVIREALK